MRKIKVKICGFIEDDKISYGRYIISILRRYYDVELSEDPEYLFFNESSFEHLDYKCIKIFYTGENIHPNFNFCDYAFGHDYINFGDRYYRFPVYMVANFYRDKELDFLKTNNLIKKDIITQEDLDLKKGFCSFVYSNYCADNNRKDFFEILSKYKKVNSGGVYLNNIGRRVDNKLEFELSHKFSIAFENSSNFGYTTEKITNAIIAKTIPIYWGNPYIEKEFNEKRFINCHKYENFEQVVDRIKEIDNDDDLYLEIVNENCDLEKKEIEDGFVTFIRNIIDQPIDSAVRLRINTSKYISLKKNEKMIFRYIKLKSLMNNILTKIYKPFKNIKKVEEYKQKFFINRTINK